MPQRSADNTSSSPAGGAEATADDLLPLVYDQLAALAGSYLGREQSDLLLEPSVLVHEAYLKLAANPPGSWKSTEHFLAVAAIAMRKILIDHARRRRALKRGFGRTRVALDLATSTGEREVDIREVDEALHKLEGVNERAARIVELRFFAGLTNEEAARVLDVSRKTVVKDWGFAREWLAEALGAEDATERNGRSEA
ncbi:MAG: ECF-type sigma factor [Planctomycetota bacterium]|nr:ECF-type sigma factor [Planctomycetota bacterium]